MIEAAALEAPSACSESVYIVLDDADRIVQVDPACFDVLGPWLGQVLWDRLPSGVSVFGPCLHAARVSGRASEAVVYYAGRVKRLVATPAADGLRLEVTVLEELDFTTLGTLAESLLRTEAELSAPEREQRDPRAHASPRALL